MDVLGAIQTILNDKLDIDPAQINAESTFDSLQIDSLDMVELIVELEDTLDVEFGSPEGLTTVGDLITYIETL